MAAKPSSAKQSINEPKSGLAVSYNDFKEYEGQRYTGMKIGRSHKWYYDPGRVEGKENNSRPVADRICGDQAPCRTRSGRIRRSGWYRVPLVRPRTSKHHQTERER